MTIYTSSRSYWDIVPANMFNFFNNILFAIGIALVALGQYNDAFTSVGQGLVNALIGTIQEINAKRKLDKIALTLFTVGLPTLFRHGGPVPRRRGPICWGGSCALCCPPRLSLWSSVLAFISFSTNSC